MAYFTQHVYVVLAIGRKESRDVFLSEQQYKEKQWLEQSIHTLTLQQEMYLQEI